MLSRVSSLLSAVVSERSTKAEVILLRNLRSLKPTSVLTSQLKPRGFLLFLHLFEF